MEKEPKTPPKEEPSNIDVAGAFDVDDPKAREAMDKLLASRRGDDKKIKPQH